MTVFILGLEGNFFKSPFNYGYSFYLGAVVAFIGYWSSYYFRLQLGVGYLLSYALTMIICLYTSLYIGIISWFYTRWKTRYAWFNLGFLFPSLWVLTELVRGLFFPRSWYALGYTQVNNFFFRGYYPIFGVYFVSWLIVALSGGIAYIILFKRNKSWQLSLLGIFIFLSLSYKLAIIKYTQKQGAPISIALLQPNIFSSKNYTQDTLLEIEAVTNDLMAKTSADLYVLPETIFGTDYHYLTPGYLDSLKKLAARYDAQIIFGSPINWQDQLHQTGIISSDNPDAPIYLKHHLVPFGEYNPLKHTFFEPLTLAVSDQINEYIAGDEIQPVVTIKNYKFAFNICYENAINDYVAKNAQNAEILLNQSDLSWYGETTMKDAFLQFSQARALENQRYFLQDGNTGDTAVISPQGVIEQRIPAFKNTVLSAVVQGYQGITPFQKLRNIPIYILCLCSIISAFLLPRHNK